ncbi:MAG: hypothetical protein M0Z54_05035 [Thermaerobacter sp.]|nr:hypothetical protein [Thermaerobacter sp.]
MTSAGARKARYGLTLASSVIWLSLIPPALAIAQRGPTVTPGSVTLTGATRSTVEGQVTFQASAQDPNGTALYQFWVQEPNGQWVDAQNYSASSSFTLATPSAGNYLVAVDVMDESQVAAGDWSAAQTTLPDGVFVQSAVTVSASTTDAPAGTSVTLSATAQNIFEPLYQFWWEQNGQWHQSGNYQSSNTFSFTPPGSGAVTYVAYAKSPLAANNPHGALMSPLGTTTEYGQASQVAVSVASPTVVADGLATDTVTVTVEDSNHNTVVNFNGSVVLTGSSSHVNFVGQEGPATVSITSGVGTVQVDVGSGYGGTTYTLAADHLQSAATSAGGAAGQGQVANVSYGSATVSALVAQAASLTVTPMLPSLANNFANGDTVWVGLNDQAANLNATSVGRYVTLTLTGPGSFSPSATQTTESVYIPTGTAQASAQVYDVPSGSGSIVVSAAASGLAGASATIGLDEVGAANHLAISTSQVFMNGSAYTEYQIEVVDQNGNLVTTGAGADATFTLRDNAQQAQLYYYPNATETTHGVSLGTDYTSSNISSQSITTTSGLATVYVSTDYTHTATNPTITVTDTTTGFTATAAYNFAAPVNAYAVLTPAWMEAMFQEGIPDAAASCNRQGLQPHGFSLLAGHSTTVSAQLTNQFGTPVAEAGQPIWFELLQQPGGHGMLPNGASQSGDFYEAFTNGQGVATIQVSTPSGAPATGTDSFAIQVFGQSDLGQGTAPAAVASAWMTDPYTVVPPSSFAASLTVHFGGLDVDNGAGVDIPWSGTGSLPAGATVSGLDVQAFNALGAPVSLNNYWNNGGDGLVVTSSNSGVASFQANGCDAWSFGIANQWFMSDEWNSDDNATALNLKTLHLGHAGTATITIQDVSNPTVPPVSFTVKVVPGPATSSPEVELNGAPISSTNPLTLNTNQSEELQLVNVDAGGDPIPNSTGQALAVVLPPPPTGFVWRTTAAGPTSSGSVTVDIPVNASSAPVWLVGTASGATTDQPISGSD